MPEIEDIQGIQMCYWPSLFSQDGWILASSFFLCFYQPRQNGGPKKRQKKNKANVQPSWPNKQVNKEFIIWPRYYTNWKNSTFVVTKQAITSGQDHKARMHLAFSGSLSQHRIRFIFPACWASHKMTFYFPLLWHQQNFKIRLPICTKFHWTNDCNWPAKQVF